MSIIKILKKGVFSIIFLAFLCLTMFYKGEAAQKIDFIKKGLIPVPEPSDAFYMPDENMMYVVSDNGILKQIDMIDFPAGKYKTRLQKTATYRGIDFEGICVRNHKIYVMDEAARMVNVFEPGSLKLFKRIPVNYNGHRNRGFESLAYNSDKRCFTAATEKSPLLIFEFDDHFSVKNVLENPDGLKEISSLRWYKGYMFALSDEYHRVYMLDSETYQIKQEWEIRVINPEGLAFDERGHMYVISDDMEMVYVYNIHDPGFDVTDNDREKSGNGSPENSPPAKTNN